nr:BppU family phage baseplate upper protein [Bacillus thuringiensis]
MKFDLTYPSEQIKIVQRLGEKTSTDILVQVFNKGVPYNLAGMTLGFELRTDNNKIIIDKEQSRFTIVEPLKGVFSYRMHPNAQSFEGNAYIAYFTFEQGGARITTERFRVLNDEDVQNVCAPDVQQHYVSVIDDLVASNQSAMAEAQAIRDMINANQVVKKTDIYSDYLQSSGNTKVLANGTDLNTIQATGCYGGNAFVNAPEGLASYLYLEVLRYSDVKYVKQIATVLAGGSVPRVYVRRMSNNVWEPWFESISSAGGVFNGNINLDRKAAESRDITYRKDGADQLSVGVSNADKFRLWDAVNRLTAFEYAPLTRLFTMFSDVALPKGALVTGPLTISGTMSQLRIDDKGPSIRIDQPNDTTTTSARGLAIHENNVMMGGFGRIRNGTTVDQMYMGWGANPWSENTSLTVSDTKFLYKNKPVAMRDKDGQSALTLTAEATNVNSGYMPLAERRGNTVTVRMEITRNANSSSPVVCNLPGDMRPPITISQNFIGNDGSIVGVNVIWDGKVEVYATGKPVKIAFTYVVN